MGVSRLGVLRSWQARGPAIFKTSATNVAAPVPVVVKVMGFCLALNVIQSTELTAPRFNALAVGRLSVWVSTDDDTLKSDPAVPATMYCVFFVSVFIDDIPLENDVIIWHRCESWVC